MKHLAFFLVFVLLIGCLSGCGTAETYETTADGLPYYVML